MNKVKWEMRKVAILGHFGADKTILDGQTIKTRILYDELCHETNWTLKKVDTYYKEKRPIKLLLDSLKCFSSTKDIIVLLSGRGMRVYFPILFFFSKVFHVRVYQDMLGGNMDMYVEKYPRFKKYLNSFVVNWSETSYVKRKMDEYGISNFEVLPNFKKIQCITEDELIRTYDEPYKLCTFSRVMKEKGIEDAITAVKTVNNSLKRIVFTLDIYGQVDKDQHEWFEMIQKQFPTYIRYGGEIPYDKSAEVLKEYFALLFPTQFYTEGMPGTIIDAYAAGVPVIASKWRSFDDAVQENKTGMGYEFGNIGELITLLLKLADNPNMMVRMKTDCLKKASVYLPKKNIERIIKKVEQQ